MPKSVDDLRSQRFLTAHRIFNRLIRLKAIDYLRPRKFQAFEYLDYLALRLFHCRVSLFSLLPGLAFMWFVTPVQDLFLDYGGVFDAALYCVSLSLFWAIPVHYAARFAVARVKIFYVDSKPRISKPRISSCFISAVDVYLPRVLGGLTFAASLVGIYRAYAGLAGADGLDEAVAGRCRLMTMAFLVAFAAQIFCVYILVRSRAMVMLMRSRIVSILMRSPRKGPWKSPATVFQVLSAGYAVFVVIMFARAIYAPSEFARSLGRANLLPIILGGWVPVFGFLAVLSQRTRWPVMTMAILAIVIGSTFADRFHDVRTYESPFWKAAQNPADAQKQTASVQRQVPPAQRQVPIDDAISGWMLANGCANNADLCPPAVLLAAEGGASRAAFQTASVLGQMLDATRSDPQRYHDFGNALFAMSGVSGGAVGVAIGRTALLEAGTAPAANEATPGTAAPAAPPSTAKSIPPCKEIDSNWFGAHRKDALDPKTSWRACLQLLTAGDYLSATAAGFAFRDYTAFLLSFFSSTPFADRAVLLEQAIEAHYNQVVYGEPTSCAEDPAGADQRGLCRAFGYLEKPSLNRWLPLLFLNATSAETGRQVIASDLNIGAVAPNEGRCEELFPLSYNVFELLAAGEKFGPLAKKMLKCAYPLLQRGKDIKLSTAAVLSARFPIVSPPGNLRGRDQKIMARVADGGYFDNSGLDTINQLIPLLRAKGLHVLVLRISNDPSKFSLSQIPGRSISGRDPEAVRLAPLEQGFWAKLYVDATSALSTLEATRAGHEEWAAAATRDLVSQDKNSSFFAAKVFENFDGTRPQSGQCAGGEHMAFTMKDLSMNWWLSPTVQQALDTQLCDERTVRMTKDVLRQLERGVRQQ